MVSASGRLSAAIDYTLLRPECSEADIERLCEQAVGAEFAAVCVNGVWVSLAARCLDGSPVSVASVAGFPLGANHSHAKATEAQQLVESGADEIDMVLSIGHLVDGDLGYVSDDIARVVEAAGGRIVKVILETAALTEDQIVAGATTAKRVGAGMVKTSTGFHPKGGATTDAVRLLRNVVGDEMGVKASGGIRDVATAYQMIEAGASRIGTSTLLTE